MAEAKKTTKKTKADEVRVKQAEKLATEESTEKLKELVETEAIAEAIVEAEKEIQAEEVEVASKTTAKAGKRSAKAVKESEEKQAKQERKQAVKTDEAAAKPAQKPPRSKMERSGKKYREVYELVDRSKSYELSEALELATKTSTTKFDSSVEIHIKLGVDPKQADQNIRGTVTLPGGTGKQIRIAVLCEAEDEDKAKKAGADITGSEALFTMLDKEKIDFDVLIASPSQMARLGKYAKLLGPRGLMPNPKSGTVNADVAKAVSEAKSGKVEYRVDGGGIIHLAIGKVSFNLDMLNKNASEVITAVKAAKPASVKGIYIQSVFLSSTMGPSVRVAAESL